MDHQAGLSIMRGDMYLYVIETFDIKMIARVTISFINGLLLTIYLSSLCGALASGSNEGM